MLTDSEAASSMYTLSQLRRGIRQGLSNPTFFVREMNRLYHRRFYRREYNLEGVDVIAEDWDVLIILDACRYDTFAETHDLPGRLEERVSRGTHTREFLRGNFHGRDLRDTVYVTASPQLYKWRDRITADFHDVVNVWREDGWDNQYGTVLPETMEEYVQRAADEYPHKRIIAHFMQPHYPFIGSGQQLNTGRLRKGQGADVWGLLRRNGLDVEPQQVMDAIRDNLQAVLPVVESLMTEIKGHTVVTSDHGNMVGESSRPIPMQEWGHPPGIYTDQLTTIPWLVYDVGERRDTKRVVAANRDSVSGTRTGQEAPSIDEETVEARLQQLGYVDD